MNWYSSMVFPFFQRETTSEISIGFPEGKVPPKLGLLYKERISPTRADSFLSELIPLTTETKMKMADLLPLKMHWFILTDKILDKSWLLYMHILFKATNKPRFGRKINCSQQHMIYNQTCLKGSPKGRTKFGCLRQVTPLYRFIGTVFRFKGSRKSGCLRQ